ncbi:MAG: superoxide dismutase family protein [Cyanobacteria bacterium J06638_22]
MAREQLFMLMKRMPIKPVVKSGLRKLTRRLSLILLLGVLFFLYLGVQGEAFAASGAIAQLASTGGGDLSGTVTFIPTADGLQVKAEVTSAPPGLHGFHIHETASCANGGKGAGGHFNPDGVKHGRLATDGFDKAHAGDMGNLFVDFDGVGLYEQEFPGLSLEDGQHAIASRAVILHAKMDSYVQPTGAAGGRIGCGVIALQ